MWNYLQALANSALKSTEGMNPREWMTACAILMVIGFLCLRGFGSRSNY